MPDPQQHFLWTHSVIANEDAFATAAPTLPLPALFILYTREDDQRKFDSPDDDDDDEQKSARHSQVRIVFFFSCVASDDHSRYIDTNGVSLINSVDLFVCGFISLWLSAEEKKEMSYLYVNTL